MQKIMAFFLLLVSFFLQQICIAQTVKDYEERWKKVDELITEKNLPKSALSEVQHIYALAKKEKQEAQVIKALVYMIGLQQENRENNLPAAIKEVEKEITLNTAPATSILKSLLADLYLQYFYQHRWQLYNRTNTTGTIQSDITTWSTEDFHQKISQLYLASIANDTLLKKTKLEPYDALITKGNVRYLRPTLYDLLAHKALVYFKSSEREIKKAAHTYEIKEPEAFAPASIFARFKFETRDSLSLHHKALLIYQNLIAFHLPDEKRDALIDVDIDRLQFVYENSIAEEKKELYKTALQHIINSYSNNPIADQASYLLAAYYEQLATTYNALKDTTHRYERLKAKEILERVVKDSSIKSEGWTNSYNLLKEINKNSFSFETEKVNLPQQPFRALVKYRNITALNFRLVKNTEKLERERYENYNKYWEALVNSNALRNWQQPLPATNDLQEHAAEVKIDALPIGEYLLLASVDTNFAIKNNVLGAQSFYVSAIGYLNQDRSFFVANRETGQPLAKASVEVFTNQYDYKTSRSVKKSLGQFKTDKNGFFLLPERKERVYNGYLLDIKHDKHHLFIDDPIYQYYYNNEEAGDEEDEDAPKKIFFFTDRSIYRPGQTVYFKGIVLQKKGEQSIITTGYEDEIFLEDANGKDVDSLEITTNEYGSFSGKFQLPQNTLNGEFKIYDDEDDNEIIISVEEYKRPKFYVEFDKLKDAYKAGDSISIKGNAKAYAGNTIDGAKVIYRVVRQPRFVYPWLFRGYLPTVQSMEITHGETTTNSNGQFTILFKAIPDLTINKNFDPVFDYKIYADVTDVNGETRSGESMVSAGYKSLLLTINAPERIAVDSLTSLFVQTTNMNGEYIPAAVSVTASKLLPENRLIRNRYWQQPDQFVMNKETFIHFFPNDEYKDENDYHNWQKSAVVFSRTDSTTANSRFSVDSSKFPVGFYSIEAITKDKEGQEIKNVRFLEVYDPNAAILTKPEYLWTKTGNTVIEPEQKTFIQVGTSATNVFLVQQIERNEKSSGDKFSFTNLNSEKKTFNLSATESDRGGFGVTYFFIKDNRIHQYNTVISVPWSNKELNIAYTSFRDKTLPGSEEKWSVKITGYKNEKAAAEMLASMYDASLDQFKPHSWSVPYVWPVFSQLKSWNGSNNFGQIHSAEKRDFVPGKYYAKVYDRLISINSFHDLAEASQRSFSRRSNAAADSIMAAAPSLEKLDEVVVTGYSTMKRASVTGAIAVRGVTSLNNTNTLYVVDGIVVEGNPNINAADIMSMSVLKGVEASNLYGARAANGVVVITTKPGAQQLPLQEITTRKNFNETAFFFPDLKTDKDGNIEFSFTMPEALTKWKLQTLAHTKELAFGLSSKEVITQKELMVQPNMPRFLREGDHIELSAKIVNLSDKELTGQAELQLLDATTNQPVDGWFQNLFPNQYFTVAAGGSEALKFPIEVPFNFNKALVWRIVAKSGNYSDGEEAALPVLTNKILVTETLPLPMKGTGTKKFMFEKLLNASNSETLQHQALTVEYTSNPAWYVVQALPYLMEYPYECAEQTWNRYYANALATKIVNAAPRLKQIFEQWTSPLSFGRGAGGEVDTAALLSNLQKNEELKSILMQEAPWVLQAKTETEQKKNIALLFDMVRMNKELKSNFEKLKTMQTGNGGFVWFKGGPDDRYITQYIVTGIGHLQKLGAVAAGQQDELNAILQSALPYLDKKLKEDYDNLVKAKADLSKQSISNIQVQYLYLRSFFAIKAVPQASQTAYHYFYKQAQKFWMKHNKFNQGMIALALNRTGDMGTAKSILASLKETAINDEELGMYWKENSFGKSWFWWQAPIETQALLIEAFAEIDKNNKTTDDLKTWLLKNKQTNNWSTTKATADACYALLLQGTDWLQAEPVVTIQLGNATIRSTEEKEEAGTGYFKKTVEGRLVKPEMGNISVTVHNANAQNGTSTESWGTVYWQYFEDLDKITSAATPLQLNKKLFLEKNSDRGPVLTPVEEGAQLKVGDKLKVRIELRVDRDMEYMHMKDMRASALEPVNVLSGYKWQGGLGYYESTKDASTNFFFNYLSKGTYVFEYPLFVTHSGNFSNGITTIQCMYAPEFSAHSEGVRINVREP